MDNDSSLILNEYTTKRTVCRIPKSYYQMTYFLFTLALLSAWKKVP